MTWREAHWFKVGTHVRVKGYRGTATVEAVYYNIPGGRRLDRPFDGFVSWNVADLRKVHRKTRAK